MHDDRWLTESLNRMTLTLLLSDSCAQDDVNKDSLPFLFTVFLGEKQASTFFEIGRFLTAAAAAAAAATHTQVDGRSLFGQLRQRSRTVTLS